MSVDRTDRYGDGLTGLVRRAESPGRVPDIADDDGTADTRRAERAPLWLPTKEERIAAYWHNRRNADAVEVAYAAAQRTVADHADTSAEPGARPRDGAEEPARAAGSQDRNTDNQPSADPPISPEKPSPTEEALLKRVAELEAEKTSQDRHIAAQGAKIASQDSRIADQSAELASRARGGEAERAESKEAEHTWCLPTDAVNNVISIAAGGSVTELAYHVSSLSPEVAGVGAYAASLGAGIIAVLRERRKAKDDADHRPEG